MSKNIIVTGGRGFVGTHLVERLRSDGYRVRSFDISGASHPDDISGSILDISALTAAFAGADIVFHLAANAQLWSKAVSYTHLTLPTIYSV